MFRQGLLVAAGTVAALFGGSASSGDSPSLAIALGGDHTCALVDGGVKCWGENRFGQLGDGTTISRSTPVAVSGLTSGVQAVAAGGDHTCALVDGGGVLCWGGNNVGQLGDGTTTDRRTPVRVSGLASGVEAIAAGGSHTCALRSGAAICWGWNRFGQLGDATTIDRSTPVSVPALSSGVRAISAGDGHTCALTSTGAVKCWGDNEYGQVGDGTTASRSVPVAVSGLAAGAQAISAGPVNTCALLGSSRLECWGPNNYGQLGTGAASNPVSKPVAVSGLSGVLQATVGEIHACALSSGGSVKCWGSNRDGQLGDGTTTDRSSPVAVSGLAGGVQAISAGTSHSCAVSSGGNVKCWGLNGAGQLGDGTKTKRSKPVRVLGLASGVRVLSVRVTGRGTLSAPGIRCSSRCAFERPNDTQIVLSERAAKGWRFTGWGGACKGRSPRCTVVLGANAEVAVRFVKRR